MFPAVSPRLPANKKAVLADGFVKEALGRLTAAPEHGQQPKSAQQAKHGD
ncbi:MAG: hypothetical protein BWX84_01393 [Verrucomicrobia bacterium ADurb.Bin118]|nr:MAG: hypothetical protein BWX84_01393 [Verrucomicrobia bacterium ADurb.Bin118]